MPLPQLQSAEELNMKHLYLSAFADLMLLTGSAPLRAADAPPSAPVELPGPKSGLVIYSTEGTRGYRVVWMAEELGIPYSLALPQGLAARPAGTRTMHSVNPLMTQSPTVFYNGTMMVESSAILDFLQDRFGKGKLAPKKDSPDYMDYLQWLHFAEGSALPVMFSEIRGGRYANIGPAKDKPVVGRKPDSPGIGTASTMRFLDAYLADHPYFGGQTFSGADIMMHFIWLLGPDPNYFSIDMAKYPHFTAWAKKVEARPAYIRTKEITEPDHAECPRLPNCTPVTSANAIN